MFGMASKDKVHLLRDRDKVPLFHLNIPLLDISTSPGPTEPSLELWADTTPGWTGASRSQSDPETPAVR